MLSGNGLFKSAIECRIVTNYVSLRWKSRPLKPCWMGMAKSKLFFIPEKKQDPPEQLAELKRLHRIYERQMRALKNFMATNIDHIKGENDIAPNVEQSKLLHDQWNAESARLREERLKKQEQIESEKILNKIMEREKNLEKIRAKVESIVQREIELSETYITEENLDKAIDECIGKVVDYNYALDLSGNIYEGNSMKPTDKVKQLISTNETEVLYELRSENSSSNIGV